MRLTSRFIALCVLSLSIGMLDPHVLAADAMERCLYGRSILEVSAVDAVRDKQIAVVQEAAAEAYGQMSELEVEVSSDERSALFEDSAVSEQLGEFPAVPRDDALELCEEMRNVARELRASDDPRDVRLAGRVPRKCSCDGVVQISQAVPNDPLFPGLWGLHQANDIDIDAPEAWGLTTGSNEVVVAVVDTGIDYTHPDLRDNMWVNDLEIAGNGIDDDNNGIVDDMYGANFVSWTSTGAPGNPFDDHGHGTHCAGTIGGRGNNATLVAGVNWNVKLLALKVLSASGQGSFWDAKRALDYLRALKMRGVNIVASSNSWGGRSSLQYWDVQQLQRAVEAQRDAGILFIAAAGNDGRNVDAGDYFPSGYVTENVISVAALGPSGTLASFSNYGTSRVHIAAPGVSITSTIPGNRTATWNGTSMATPHVSGVVALLAAYQPHLEWDQLRELVLNASTYVPAIAGSVQGGRFLNAHKVLTESEHSRYAPGERPTPTPRPTSTPTFTPTPLPTATPTPTPTFTPTPPATPTPEIGPYTVAVEVKAEIGGETRPVAGAVVHLKVGTSLYSVRTTNSSGVCSFADISMSPGNYSVWVVANGYNFPEQRGYLRADTTVRFSAAVPFAVLSGRVIDTEEEPIAGVSISLGRHGEAVTDADGHFEVALPVGEDYEIEAAAPGYYFDVSRARGTLHGDSARVIVGYIDILSSAASDPATHESNEGRKVRTIRRR